MGLKVDIRQMTADSLYNDIRTMLGDRKYIYIYYGIYDIINISMFLFNLSVSPLNFFRRNRSLV